MGLVYGVLRYKFPLFFLSNLEAESEEKWVNLDKRFGFYEEFTSKFEVEIKKN